MTALNQNERLIKVSGEHWIKYVLPVAMAICLFSIAVFLLFLAGLSAIHEMWVSHASFITGMALLLFTHHWFFMTLLGEALDGIIITNKRLIRTKCRLIFHEDFLEVSFEKMKTVDSEKRGILQNLFHYGTLMFENNKATIRLVPRPNHIAHLIQEAMSQA